MFPFLDDLNVALTVLLSLFYSLSPVVCNSNDYTNSKACSIF